MELVTGGTSRHESHAEGASRTCCGYLWIPRFIEGEWRWLCWQKWQQEWKCTREQVRDVYTSPLPGKWIDTKWLYIPSQYD